MTPRRRQVPVSLPPQTWERLAKAAAARGVAVDVLIQEAVARDLRAARARKRKRL